ncbi:MAG: LapA family protein [Patescibacteria group bacterium]
MLFLLILGIVLGALSVLFALQNVAVVTVTFFSWQMTAPLALVLLSTILTAVIVTLLVLLPSLIQEAMYVKALKKQKRELEDEFSAYRTGQPVPPASVAAQTVSRTTTTTTGTEAVA